MLALRTVTVGRAFNNNELRLERCSRVKSARSRQRGLIGPMLETRAIEDNQIARLNRANLLGSRLPERRIANGRLPRRNNLNAITRESLHDFNEKRMRRKDQRLGGCRRGRIDGSLRSRIAIHQQ